MSDVLKVATKEDLRVLVRGFQKQNKELESQLATYKAVHEAAKKLFSFNEEQYVLHKNLGDYEHRDKNTLDLLEAIYQVEALNNKGDSDGDK